MSDFVNDVKFLSLTAGTLNFTIGAALSGFQKPTSAQGFVSGLVYSYSARTQAGQFESGTGICNGVTQARTTINDGSAGATVKVDFSDPPTVVLTVLSNDMLNLVAETIILGDGTVLSGLGISDATVLGAWTNNVSSYGALVTYDTGSGGPTNVNAAIQIVNYSQDAYGDGVNSFYARGTRASPVIVQDADQLGATSFYGHDGANFQLTAQIYAVVDGAPSAGSVPTAVVITSGDGVTTAEHVRVDSNGTTSISGVLSQGGGFAYLGQFNSPTYPDTGIGAAFSWNFSGGSGEVDIWNTFAQTATDDDSPAFSFKSMSGTGAGHTIASMYPGGRFKATLLNAGSITGQATQLELQETGLTGSSALAQVVISRTEADTPPGGTAGEEAQLIISGHRTGGTGSRDGILLGMDATTGSDGEFMVALNASTTAKKTGAAYNLDVFGATIGAGADAALPNVDVVALECDIQVKGDVARKVGLQVIDVVSSTGRGTSLDAGILIGKQAGARGFDYGIQFGDASEQNLALFYAPTGTIPYAVDFSGVTFSTAAWKGNFSVSGIVIAPLLTPANSTASGVTGSIQWDASFIYVCTTTNNWKRSALSSF